MFYFASLLNRIFCYSILQRSNFSMFSTKNSNKQELWQYLCFNFHEIDYSIYFKSIETITCHFHHLSMVVLYSIGSIKQLFLIFFRLKYVELTNC